MTDLEIAKTLRDAGQYIRDYGWIQSGEGYGRIGRPACAMHAIPNSCGVSTMGDPGWERVENACAALNNATKDVAPPAPAGMIPLVPAARWNDAPGRTVAEVLDLFESVALQHELRALAVTPLSQEAATAVCDNTVPEAVNV